MGFDNYQTVITVPATDDNFKAALKNISNKDLLRVRDYLALHTFANKNRARAVQSEIKRRKKEGKF